MGVRRREAQSPGPSWPRPQSCSSAREPGALVPAGGIAPSPVSPSQIWVVVGDSQRSRDACGGFSWSACVLAEVAGTHPSCPEGGLPLSTRSASRGVDHKTEIAWLPFLLFLSSFIRFSFLLHAAQRMQKAAKIKKKAVCGAVGFSWVSGPRPVQFWGAVLFVGAHSMRRTAFPSSLDR